MSASALSSPFRTLAKDVLQLIMQQLDSQSLLSLARVSRFTFAAAQSEAAWRGRLIPITAETASKRMQCSLLRFADVSLLWHEDGWQTMIAEQVYSIITPLIRLRALRFQVRLKASEWQWLWMAHQACKLRVVILHTDALSFRANELSILAERLPLVHTLGLTIGGACPPDFLSPLPKLKCLTDLRLCMDDAGQDAAHIGSCAALHKFHWKQLRTREHGRILASRQLQSNLVELTLERCHADEPKGWLTVFNKLSTLRVLRLQDLFVIDEVLTELSNNDDTAVLLLERLEIGVAAASSTFLHARPFDPRVVVPSAQAVRRIVVVRRSLQLVLYLQPLASFLKDAGAVETRLVTTCWNTVTTNYALLAANYPERVTVIEKGMLDD